MLFGAFFDGARTICFFVVFDTSFQCVFVGVFLGNVFELFLMVLAPSVFLCGFLMRFSSAFFGKVWAMCLRLFFYGACTTHFSMWFCFAISHWVFLKLIPGIVFVKQNTACAAHF
jgi:hypothetical protein